MDTGRVVGGRGLQGRYWMMLCVFVNVSRCSVWEEGSRRAWASVLGCLRPSWYLRYMEGREIAEGWNPSGGRIED